MVGDEISYDVGMDGSSSKSTEANRLRWWQPTPRRRSYVWLFVVLTVIWLPDYRYRMMIVELVDIACRAIEYGSEPSVRFQIYQSKRQWEAHRIRLALRERSADASGGDADLAGSIRHLDYRALHAAALKAGIVVDENVGVANRRFLNEADMASREMRQELNGQFEVIAIPPILSVQRYRQSYYRLKDVHRGVWWQVKVALGPPVHMCGWLIAAFGLALLVSSFKKRWFSVFVACLLVFSLIVSSLDLWKMTDIPWIWNVLAVLALSGVAGELGWLSRRYFNTTRYTFVVGFFLFGLGLVAFSDTPSFCGGTASFYTQPTHTTGIKHLGVGIVIACISMMVCGLLRAKEEQELKDDLPGMIAFGTLIMVIIVYDATVRHAVLWRIVSAGATVSQSGSLYDVASSASGPELHEVLRRTKALSELRGLDLSGSGATDTDMVLVGRMKQLRSLSIQHTAVTDAGMRYLGDLDRLRVLRVYGSGVRDPGFIHLQQLPELWRLWLDERQYAASGVQALMAVNPKVKAKLVEVSSDPFVESWEDDPFAPAGGADPFAADPFAGGSESSAGRDPFARDDSDDDEDIWD